MASRQPYSFQEIPPFVQYTSPVSYNNPTPSPGSQLPLNLIALIVSYLDDIGDIARVTRTSRLLYYMTLPQLYQHVALHSYADIRYVNGRPEGFGSGSPFMMALNGLATKSYASVVRDLRLWGDWKEPGADDFAKGRVPDNSMLLNMMLRVCVDKMTRLQSFSWELDCKPLKTLYQGLSARDTLTSLTIKFPSSRLPRPSVCIPGMPNLVAFSAIDIDPLCYPDDISVLLLGSKNLRDLRLHFSPRMRRSAEPTLNLDTYFGRCSKAGYVPKLKHFAMQNWFGPHTHSLSSIMNHKTCESMTFLDTFGGAQGGSANVYVDDTWRDIPLGYKTDFRSIRFNEFAEQHVDMINASSGLEYVYVVNDRAGKPSMSSSVTSPSSDYITPDDSPSATTDPLSRLGDIPMLGQQYVRAFTTNHGSSLKHLLLSAQWPLSEADLTNLIRACPNLTQLGLALNFPNHSTLRLVLPFLTNLYAIRILYNHSFRSAENDMASLSEDERIAILGRDLYLARPEKLRWIGSGEAVYKVGASYEHVSADGTAEMRRLVERVDPVEVADVEMWKLDSLDIMAESRTGG
ncbi:hypothetical protein Q7P37_002394 [Cladosporium fusiforme]